MCCVGREHFLGGLLNEVINSVKKNILKKQDFLADNA